MGRQAAGPCPTWGTWWPAALLAAAVLSSCFLITQAQEISVRAEPPQQLRGQNVTLIPGGNLNIIQCIWYREEQTEANRIFTYIPLPPPEQLNGPGFTGRETGDPNCSLHISGLTLNDTGIYTVVKTTRGGLETGSVRLDVLERLTKPSVSAFPSRWPIEFTDSVTLTCNTTPEEVSISWFYNGDPLSSISRIKLSGDNRTVIISDAIRNDTGYYHCEVTNPVSHNISDNIYIAVIYGPDNVTIHPTERLYDPHSEISLSCYADAFPDARYVWFHDETELQETSDLLIHDVAPEDSGTYVCKAWNVLSRQESNATLEIEVAGNVSNVAISGPSTAVEYDTVELNCTSLGSLVSYYWFKGNQSVEEGDRVLLSDKNKTLTFSFSSRNDTASYVCKGVNRFSSQSSEPHRLDVFYGPDSPKIDPQESEYNEGSTLNLSCFADSNPPANYSWWYYDQLLENQTDSQLLIQTLLLSDAGNYTCNATNEETGNSSTTSLFITIRERVSNVAITSHPDKAIEHDSIVLNCSASGSKNVSYTWSIGDQELESEGHISLGYSNLTFDPVNRNDAGNYTCSARNDFSSANATYQLEVFYGPDEPVISPSRQDYGEGSVLTLICQADSHPEAQYTWYFNETELLEMSHQLTIPSLSFNQSGNYTCSVFNPETNLSDSTALEIKVLGNVSQVSIQGPSETTENSSLTLICASDGTEVSYTWVKDNQTLEIEGHISSLNPNLTLSPVDRSDTGSYTCYASNTVSNVSSDPFLLEVFYGPDDPIISPTDHDYIEGVNLNISCSADSNPVANYTWFFNENEEVGDSSQLSIFDLSFDRAGNYTCSATNNRTGISRAAVWEIRVHEKLLAPTLWPIEFFVKEHTNVTLNCNASESASVFWFKDNKTVPAKSIFSERNRTLNIPDIGRDDEGMYTCQAWNPANYATSNPSTIIVDAPAPTPTPGGPDLSPGAIVGIVIGCLVGVLIIAIVLYFALKNTSLGRKAQHSSNGNISSAPGRNQGVTDTKPVAAEEDIQYTTLAFNANRPPPPSLEPAVPLETGTIYSVIKKK